MIDWNKYDKLDKELNNKRVELIRASTIEEKNAIMAEMKNLEKQKEKVLGKNEYNRLKEARNMNPNEEKVRVENYNNLKEKMAQINRLNVATRKMVITGISKIEEQGKTYKKGAA